MQRVKIRTVRPAPVIEPLRCENLFKVFQRLKHIHR